MKLEQYQSEWNISHIMSSVKGGGEILGNTYICLGGRGGVEVV